MGEQKVNVILYGGKSIFSRKETPLSVDITYCDAADECPLRANGKCLLATRMGFDICKHGRIERHKGYTSRAMKYKQFREKYANDPLYNALDEPTDSVLMFTIGDETFVKLGLVGIEYDPDGGWKERKREANNYGMYVCDPWLGDKSLWVPTEALDADFFEQVCKFRPQAFLGGTITKFQKKNVPMIVHTLREVLPDVYAELIERCPELAERKLDHTGRYARALTLKDGSRLKDCHGNVFVKQGNHITCDSYKCTLDGVGDVTANGNATLTIEIGEKAYVEVKDNDWVCDETEFK